MFAFLFDITLIEHSKQFLPIFLPYNNCLYHSLNGKGRGSKKKVVREIEERNTFFSNHNPVLTLSFADGIIIL